MEERKKRILLIGPYPPPEHGTSIPFKIFSDLAVFRFSHIDFRIINTQSGDKANLPLYSSKVVLPFIKISFSVILEGLGCSSIILFGSSRFVASAGSIYIFFLKTICRKPFYTRIIGGSFDVYLKSLNRFPFILIKFLLKKANKLVVETEQSFNELQKLFPNMVNLPNYRMVAGRKHDKGKMKNNEMHLVYIGVVRKRKGIMELLKAYRKALRILAEYGVIMTLDIFGPLHEDLMDEFEKCYKKIDSANYKGEKSHKYVETELPNYDALVLPTYFPGEGHPAAIIEAMSAGLPVITTRFRAIPNEVVVDGVTGLLCEPGDVASLTECLIRLGIDQEKREKMGCAALMKANNFDVKRIVPKLFHQFDLA